MRRSLLSLVTRDCGAAIADGGTAPAAPFISCLFLAALMLVPLVGHGCHGDDVDHEPVMAPHRQNQSDSSMMLSPVE